MDRMCHQFPLRPGYLAQVVIPLDLTKAEADRLTAFVMALALGDETEAKASAVQRPAKGDEAPEPFAWCSTGNKGQLLLAPHVHGFAPNEQWSPLYLHPAEHSGSVPQAPAEGDAVSVVGALQECLSTLRACDARASMSNALADEIARAIALGHRALVDAQPPSIYEQGGCPYPILGDTNAAECIANGHCGCGAAPSNVTGPGTSQAAMRQDEKEQSQTGEAPK